MKREKTFFGKNQALHFVRGIFKDTTVIRIATAYFELSGYELLEQVLQGKKIKLLIGREQDTQVKLESLLDEFIENTSEMPPENRIRLLLRFRNALLNGVLDLRIGKSQDIQISPRYLDHHAKLYIADESFCLVTSANLSKTGLVISREAGYIVDEPDDVRFFVAKFDDYFAIADPLIDKLLLVLDNILSMRDAYEVYIRSLLELYGLPDYVPSGELANLNRYQMPVVARALENLRELHGSYLVASTGLGKTVMASHIAMRLKAAGSIDRVLVFSPAGLKKMWLNSLWAAGVAARAYSYSILSLNDSRKNRSVLYLEDDLRTINDRTLLILDECHHLRNIDTGNKNHEIRIRNERVSKAVELNAYLLAMTATPYARKIDDINNQLALFRSEIKSGMFGKVKVKRKISRAGELSELEIATVLTAPTVVAQYCQTDTTGSRFLQFGDGKKRYFPDAVVMSNLQYSNSLNNVLLSLLDSHLLRRNTSQKSGGQLYLSNDTSQEGRRDGLFEARLLHQFCSSPAEAISCLEKMHIEEGYENMRFVDQSKLTNLVTALLPEAKKILKEDDIKFKFLTQIIEKHSDEKIVIFCIYKKTADYLYSKISKKFKNLKVGLTSEQNTDQLEALLEDFAPIANNMIDPEVHDEFSEKVRENKVDILIATEAISEGFNLQDARLLVNYDLPWTILNLAQRMGRILRPWHKPRKIQIWNFIPDTMFSENFPHAVSWAERLNSRNKAQQSFTRLPAFGSNDKEEIQLYTIADTFAQNSDVEINLDDTLQFIQSTEGIQTSSAIDDLGRISEEEAREIRSLKSGFRAVITAQDLGINEDLRFPLLYLLIRRKSRVFAGLFSRDCELLIPFDHQLEILNNIRLQQRQEKMYNLQEAELIEYDKLLTGSLKEFAQLLKCNEDDLKIICSMKIVT